MIFPGERFEIAQIVKKVSGGYQVWSHDGSKPLSKVYKTKAEAMKRLGQIEYFKHAGK
jgi:hypothetical protein